MFLKFLQPKLKLNIEEIESASSFEGEDEDDVEYSKGHENESKGEEVDRKK